MASPPRCGAGARAWTTSPGAELEGERVAATCRAVSGDSATPPTRAHGTAPSSPGFPSGEPSAWLRPGRSNGAGSGGRSAGRGGKGKPAARGAPLGQDARPGGHGLRLLHSWVTAGAVRVGETGLSDRGRSLVVWWESGVTNSGTQPDRPPGEREGREFCCSSGVSWYRFVWCTVKASVFCGMDCGLCSLKIVIGVMLTYERSS